jgi:NAD(P)-dependent dehydrogenase (short-subunit alcohol dehydrogenase family)
VAEWRRTLEVNLTGAFLVTRAVLPHLRAAGAGSIINVSSGAALPPRRSWGAYAVAKQALDGLSLNLAAELEGSGIRVNVVDPGSMRTPMRAAAYLFLWLASDASAGVTGRRLRADEWRP